MKIIAAIGYISFVKKFHKEYIIARVKKFLVYDPSMVTGWDIEKKVKDGTE